MNPLTFLRLLLPLLALLATGCASRGPAPVTRIESPRCDTGWNLESAVVLELDPARPENLRFDAASRCFAARGGAPVNYAVLRLPRFRKAWMLTLESPIVGQSLFAPEVLTLDADGQVLRRLPFERFSMRGEHLEASLFVGEENAPERFLLVHSAIQAVGQGGTQVVSGAFVIPILTGLIPLVYMQGTERERSYTLAHSGQMRLRAQLAGASRRPGQARDIARAELGTFAR